MKTLYPFLIVAILLAGCMSTPQIRKADPETKVDAPTMFSCSMHPQIKQPKPGKCPICAMDLVLVVNSPSVTAAVFTCSMHPQIKIPQKGKCPICGMDLIPATGNK